MIRAEVVNYLRENLSQFPVEVLREQLSKEGVSEADFQESLSAALRSPMAEPAPPPKSRRRNLLKIIFAGVAALMVFGGLLLILNNGKTPGASGVAAGRTPGESGFVGANGWVVRLPTEYVGSSEFKDSTKTVEITHFSKRGTDPTNFLNDGLFGQLGIIRLTVSPSQFPANPTGVGALSSLVARKTTDRGEKFTSKPLQIGSLSGVQINIQSPFPRVEAYILGQRDLYFFYAGQEDEIWRDIVLSLRDAHSDN